jgi:hypothetical protein
VRTEQGQHTGGVGADGIAHPSAEAVIHVGEDQIEL